MSSTPSPLTSGAAARPRRAAAPEPISFVGTSPALATVTALIRKLAGCDATVLIQGETGTGKEVAARAIHYLGARRDQPFVPVNCGAIPETLVESEFFGHVRGAFTDARDACCGLIAAAEGGTLFLDEVESLQPKAQVALLRYLQDHVYRPVGGRQLMRSDVRVIAASNAPLADLASSGAFRADLMYRLAIMAVRMPPLRERPGDVALLARHFVAEFAARYGCAQKRLDPALLAAMERHDWPGNVRELENLVHRAFLLTEDETMSLRSFPFGLPAVPPASSMATTAASAAALLDARCEELDYRCARASVLTDFEKAYVCRCLARSHGNISQAARLAGKERRAFGRLMKKHGIDRRHYAA